MITLSLSNKALPLLFAMHIDDIVVTRIDTFNCDKIRYGFRCRSGESDYAKFKAATLGCTVLLLLYLKASAKS